jgi:hypothetical protein
LKLRTFHRCPSTENLNMLIGHDLDVLINVKSGVM